MDAAAAALRKHLIRKGQHLTSHHKSVSPTKPRPVAGFTRLSVCSLSQAPVSDSHMTAGAGQNTQFMCMLVRTGTFPETSAGALHEPVTCESRPGITYVTRYLGAGLTSTVTRTGILKEQQRGRQSQTVIVISPCRLHYDAMSGLAPEEALTGM